MSEICLELQKEDVHFLLVHCYWLRYWWSCLHCSTHWLDTLNTAESPAAAVNLTGSQSAMSSWSPQWREFLKGQKISIWVDIYIKICNSTSATNIISWYYLPEQRNLFGQTLTYFLREQMHKTALWDSIQFVAYHCIWWICRSWRDQKETELQCVPTVKLWCQ